MSRINAAALRKACIATHGEALGTLAFRHELATAQEFEAKYDVMLAERADIDSNLEALGASQKPETERRRDAVNRSYNLWLSDCIALEERLVQNDAEQSALRQKLSEVRTRIAMSSSRLGDGTWEKSTLFPEPLPEVTSGFHTSMHAQQQRAKEES